MSDEPDLSFDIDALFEHLFGGLEHDEDDAFDWVFTLRSENVQALNRVAEELSEEFDVQVEEDMPAFDVTGNPIESVPMLSVVRQDALTAEEVKQIANRMQAIADENGFTYQGVDCFDPLDNEEIFGWLDIDDALWRLRHFTDSGLADDSALPWCFLIQTQSLENLEAVAVALRDKGFADRDDYVQPDDDGQYHSCIFMDGVNDEAKLSATASDISDISKDNGCELVGVQFYTREVVQEIFGDDEDDEDSNQ